MGRTRDSLNLFLFWVPLAKSLETGAAAVSAFHTADGNFFIIFKTH